MKTSARNQFAGKVSKLVRGSVNDEIELDVGHGTKIVAVITHESASGLGLQVGSEALALVKASSVIIVADNDGYRFSARNRLSGSVSAIQPASVNSEVVIALANGAAIASIITNESVAALGLKIGNTASAIFKASSVIIAVRG